MEYYSATKQNEMIPLRASWIQLEITILSEVNQKEKGKYYVTLFTPGILKKKRYKWTYLQNRNRLTDLENEFKVTRRERLGRRIYYEFGINIYTVLLLLFSS